MSVLSYQSIRSRCAGGAPLVEPFEDRLLQPASYDLTVGGEYYIGGNENKAVIHRLGSNEFAWIPPNAICMVLTEQKLNMDNDIVGSLSLPLGLLRQGMFMAPQTQIDPGYCGNIAVLLYNLSNGHVKLHRGEHLVTIEFRKLDARTERPYPKDGKYAGLNSLSKVVASPLSSSLFEIRRELDRWNNRIATLVPFLLAALATCVTVMALMLATVIGRTAWTSIFGASATANAGPGTVAGVKGGVYPAESAPWGNSEASPLPISNRPNSPGSGKTPSGTAAPASQ